MAYSNPASAINKCRVRFGNRRATEYDLYECALFHLTPKASNPEGWKREAWRLAEQYGRADLKGVRGRRRRRTTRKTRRR